MMIEDKLISIFSGLESLVRSNGGVVRTAPFFVSQKFRDGLGWWVRMALALDREAI